MKVTSTAMGIKVHSSYTKYVSDSSKKMGTLNPIVVHVTLIQSWAPTMKILIDNRHRQSTTHTRQSTHDSQQLATINDNDSRPSASDRRQSTPDNHQLITKNDSDSRQSSADSRQTTPDIQPGTKINDNDKRQSSTDNRQSTADTRQPTIDN
jgi:hypothetical protein